MINPPTTKHCRWASALSLTLATLSLLTGCTGGAAREHPATAAAETMPAPDGLGRAAPDWLDESLSADDLARMFTAYDDVPWADLAAGIDPNTVDIAALLAATPRPGPSPRRNIPEAAKAYLRGRWLLQTGRSADAATAAEAGLAADPNSADLWALLGRAQLASGRTRPGVNASRRAIALNPDHMAAYHHLGVNALNSGDHKAAAVYLRRALLCSAAIRGNPMTGYVHIQLAAALDQLGYVKAAIRAYEQCYAVLREQSNYAHADAGMAQFVRQLHVPLFAMAADYVRLGWIDRSLEAVRETQRWLPAEIKAEQAFVQWLGAQRAPLQMRYRRVLAVCRYLIWRADFNHDEPIAWFYQACAELAKHRDYLDSLAQWRADAVLIDERQYAFGLALAGELVEAARLLEALSATTDNPLVWRDLGVVNSQLARWQGAIAAYGRYAAAEAKEAPAALEAVAAWAPRVAADPNTIAAWAQTMAADGNYGGALVTGYVAEVQGWSAAARTGYAAAADELALARERLIELLLHESHYEEALAAVNATWDAGHDDPALWWFAGRAGMGLGDAASAARYYQRFIESGAEDVRVYAALGAVLREQGDPARSEAVLLQVLERWPAHADVYRELILTYTYWAARTTDVARAQTIEARARDMLQQWLGRHVGRPGARDFGDDMAALRRAVRTDLAPALTDLQSRRPASPAVAMILSETYGRVGEPAAALAAVQSALAAGADDERLFGRAARLAQQAGDFDTAADYRLRQWQSSPGAWSVLAECLDMLRSAQRAEAAQDLLRAEAAAETWQVCDRQLIEAVAPAARRVFLVTRDFDAATTFFGQWWRQLAAQAAEAQRRAETEGPCVEGLLQEGSPTREEPLTQRGRAVLENAIWAAAEAEDFEAGLELAWTLYQTFDVQDSVSVLYLMRRAAISQDADDSDVLTRAAQLDPNSTALREPWLRWLAWEGRGDEAEAQARAWLAEAPQSFERRWLLTEVLRADGDLAGAAAALESYQPDSLRDRRARTTLLLGVLAASGNYEAAAAELTQAEGQDMLSGPWFELHLQLDIARGDCDAALGRLRELEGQAPPHSLRRARVELLNACGRVAEAADLQALVVADEPLDLEARLRLAILHTQAGDSAAAIALLDEALAETPDDATLMNNLGYTMVDAGVDVDRAGELLARSLAIEPTAAPTQDSVGWYWYRRGRFERALSYLAGAAAAMAEPDPEVYDHLGDVFWRLNRPHAAQRCWRAALTALRTRVVSARYLADDIGRVEAKLAAAEDGIAPAVTPLFAE